MLCAVLFVMYWNGHKMGISNTENSLYYLTRFGPLFILGYSFWNLAFVIDIGGLPTFLNFVSTLLLPIMMTAIQTAMGFARMDEQLRGMRDEIQEVKTRGNHIETRLGKIESRVSNIEGRMGQVR